MCVCVGRCVCVCGVCMVVCVCVSKIFTVEFLRKDIFTVSIPE